MAGVSVEVDVRGLDPVRRMISQLEAIQLVELLDKVGALIEGQTRRRIEKDRTSPDGKPWPAWSDKYDAAVKRSGNPNHKMLIGRIPTPKDPRTGGDLFNSIQHSSGPGELEERIGSAGIPYAAAQFYGYPPGNLPARQALGISDSNQDEIEGVVNSWLAKRLQP